MRRKLKIAFILFITAVSFLGGAIFSGKALLDRRNAELKVALKAKSDELTLLENLNTVWREGPVRREVPDYLGLCSSNSEASGCDSSFLRCNPLFLSKYIERESHALEEKWGQKIELGLYPSGLPFRAVTRSKGDRLVDDGMFYQFLLKVGQKTLTLNFSDTCNELFLPQRKYVFRAGKKTIPWDNLDRKIFVDRFRVTNFKVWLWKKEMGQRVDLKMESMAGVANRLTMKEMHQFCAFFGKQPLDVLVFMAAAEYPRNTEDPNVSIESTSHFSFSKRPYRPRALSLLKEEKEREKSCEEIYSLDCLPKFKKIDHQTKSSSWIGIHEVHGGDFEYLYNPINPAMNIKLSSIHFLTTSRNQELGKFGQWSGSAHGGSEFVLPPRSIPWTDINKGVSFRCMRLLNE